MTKVRQANKKREFERTRNGTLASAVETHEVPLE